METFAHRVADWMNPALAVIAVFAPALGPGRAQNRAGWKRAGRWWAASVAGISLAVAIAETGKARSVWAGHPTFPSGHETFALAALTGLVCWDARWAVFAASAALLMAWALVAAHFHVPIDVLGACLVGPPAALLCQAVSGRFR